MGTVHKWSLGNKLPFFKYNAPSKVPEPNPVVVTVRLPSGQTLGSFITIKYDLGIEMFSIMSWNYKGPLPNGCRGDVFFTAMVSAKFHLPEYLTTLPRPSQYKFFFYPVDIEDYYFDARAICPNGSCNIEGTPPKYDSYRTQVGRTELEVDDDCRLKDIYMWFEPVKLHRSPSGEEQFRCYGDEPLSDPWLNYAYGNLISFGEPQQNPHTDWTLRDGKPILAETTYKRRVKSSALFEDTTIRLIHMP